MSLLWTNRAQLVTPWTIERLRSAIGPQLSYNPIALYKAHSAGVRFYSKNSIDRIYDLGTSGDANRIASPIDPSHRVTYIASGINGKPAIQGHPTLPFRTGVWSVVQTQPATQYIVAYLVAGTAYFNFTGEPTNCLYGGNGSISSYAGGYGCITPAMPDGAKVICGVFDGANSRIYINNSTTPLATGNAGPWVNSVWEFLSWMPVGTHGFYAGAHDLTTRTAIMQSLGAEYGIPIA